MSRLGFKSAIYHGDLYMGELDNVPVRDGNLQFPENEIRIHHISPLSERCHPLAVLQTISSASIRCKLEPGSNANLNSNPDESPLINLHSSMFYELKTAVVLLGNEEVHLVAMASKQKKFPCFWCFSVPCRLYDSCLWMLNTRCLAIVFDLDETLIVANTMKSFEDRIEVLMGWIAHKRDPNRESVMTDEMKRYVEDRALLKQYAETDSVVDCGKAIKFQLEEIFLLADGHAKVVRPVVRLPEKNIVLTRINPENRDTSVLVRLRPAWQELKNYLTAKGRKRFEVYVCTMAERDYALEMWRLLDPESHLINSKQLLDRVVCVKSGSRKSLHNVFQDGNCHPKMAMVIDDRLNVWKEKDQPHVHVVPAFSPYYAPQAELATAVPVLCVARNVACNVRGGFFKEFDENLLRRIPDVSYEDDIVNLPSAPDVSNYLMSEDASLTTNGNPKGPISEGMIGPETFQSLNYIEEQNGGNAVSYPLSNNLESKSEISKIPNVSTSTASALRCMSDILPSEKPSLLGDPFGRDCLHSSSTGSPLLSRLPRQAPISQSQGGWLQEDTKRGNVNDKASGIIPGSFLSNRLHGLQNSHSHSLLSSVPSELYASQSRNAEVKSGPDNKKPGPPTSSHCAESGGSHDHPSTRNKELKSEEDKINIFPSSISVGVLQEIGRRCRSKIEFRPVMNTDDDLQFQFQVFLTGEKIGVGMGKTRKDAQQHAAQNALRSLADHYVSFIASQSRTLGNDTERNFGDRENGFIWDIVNPISEEKPIKNGFP